MFSRRMLYLTLLVGVGAYYVASGAWLSWILLLTVLGLPWLSLLVSLPALLTFGIAPGGQAVLEVGDRSDLWLLGSCQWPMPPFRGKIRLRCLLNGESWRYHSGENVPTENCVGYRVTLERVRVCDYLGLFSFPIWKKDDMKVVVRPKPLAVADFPAPKRRELERWMPKAGGGFAENHEHRPFRPGDPMNQIHWKLSAKVGSLIIREPQVPVRGAVLLTVSTDGTPEELDRKLGRLLWAGRLLLEKGLDFEVRALTGEGLKNLAVLSESDLLRAVDTLLCTREAADASDWDPSGEASWQYHIGGDADEA